MSFRIAMVGACPYPVPQGSQALLRETALALAQRGHEVRLVVYGYGIGEDTTGLPIHRCVRIPGARKTTAGPSFAKPPLDLALSITLRRVIRTHGIQVVHAHNYEGLLVALLARARPIVYHAHNALADELPYYFRRAPWAERLGSRLDRVLPRRADHIIAPHQRLADYLVSCGCAGDRISVIAPFLESWPHNCTCVEDEIPPVVYAGNLDAYQNLPFLLRVMDRVCATAPGARLRVISADARRITGAETVSAPDLDTLRAALACDCVFVCPRVSWSGYPIKLVNAMAAGKAIVACSSAAHPLTHGQSGLVVRDNDEDRFAAAVLELLANPEQRRRFGANARAASERFHNPAESARAIEDVYLRVVRAS
ncbi:MAG: glycosyltransferase family 4 protein [Candidatus Hydrogenedentes bacterium]|nr:glycosyltransferase family 4 protein [Candidatus Hydrogenedentota bacterium]